MKKNTYFDHPTEPIRQCIEEDCSGTMVQKKRKVSLRSGGKNVTIPDSEYWECSTCGAFVTTQKEIERIRHETSSQSGRSGRFVLRLPPELHQQLVHIASQNNRSLNREILERLQKSLAEKR